MENTIYENELRELLAKQISILGTGLTLIKKEAYIPHSIGTRSFIDLLAKDANDHFVLIELKRSDASSREAIHEILKYVEGVKEHLGVREEEICVIIASTEWRELYVPFSRFIKDTTLSVQGLKLLIDNGNLSASSITPLPMTMGRYIAPWHELNFYENKESLERGINEYEAAYAEKGANNFVMLVMKAPESFEQVSQAQAHQAMMQMAAQFGAEITKEQVAAHAKTVPPHQYILYIGMQIMSKEECLALLEKDSALHAEVMEFLPEMQQEEGEEAALLSLHEYWQAMEPTGHSDFYRIGYAAKLKATLIEDEGWEVIETRRYGTFSKNMLLSDDNILGELCGNTGTAGQSYKASINTSHKGQLSAAKEGCKRALLGNPVWFANTAKILEEIGESHTQQKLNIDVYNPCAGIITLFLTTTREDGALYIPQYSISLEQEGEAILYFGCLVPEGNVATFQHLLKKYYDDNIRVLLLTLTWGGYEERDSEILEDCGLVYRSFKCVMIKDARKTYELRNERWQEIETCHPFDPFFSYLNTQEALIKTIIKEIGSRWDGRTVVFD